MDKVEAYTIIQEELDAYKKKPYSELVSLIDNPQTKEVRGKSSTLYQTEVQVFWDDKKEENIRIIGSIDNMSWYAFSPLTEDFIMVPNGKIINGEKNAT